MEFIVLGIVRDELDVLHHPPPSPRIIPFTVPSTQSRSHHQWQGLLRVSPRTDWQRSDAVTVLNASSIPLVLLFLLLIRWLFPPPPPSLHQPHSHHSNSSVSFFFLVQWKFSITRSLGPGHFVRYIRYFVISVVNKQYKTKEIDSLGPEKLVCYIR